MRVTDTVLSQMLQDNVNSSLTNLNNINQEISTGKQINTMSDNPSAASEILAYQQSLADNQQYQQNATNAQTFLSTTNSALSNAATALQQGLQIATQGANGTENQQDLTALSSQVTSIITETMSIANTDVGGQYVFGGTQTGSAPFAAAASASSPPVYSGNNGTINAVVGKNSVIQVNTPGSTAFGGIFTALTTLQNDLAAGNQSAVSSDIGTINTAISNLTDLQANLGATTQQLTETQTNLQRSATDYTAAISNLQDTDLATAYVQLQQAQNVYQASLVTVQKAYQYSLASYV